MRISPEQNQRINDARMLAENCRTAIHCLLNELTGKHYDEDNADEIDALNKAMHLASETRLALRDAVDFDLLKQHPKPSLLTEREQKAIDSINAVLNGDGTDPESGPGAWSDCGEVVPILLDLVARLTK